MFIISILDHDESIFRSNEVSHKGWIVEHKTPFFSKGQGRSHMVSDFLVAHLSGPCFSLSQEEFDLAAKQYPSLKSDINDLNFIKCSVIARVNVGRDGHVGNDTISYQFERSFQLLLIRRISTMARLRITVDNARIHPQRSIASTTSERVLVQLSCQCHRIRR